MASLAVVEDLDVVEQFVLGFRGGRESLSEEGAARALPAVYWNDTCRSHK
jgi:hypothetical protein